MSNQIEYFSYEISKLSDVLFGYKKSNKNGFSIFYFAILLARDSQRSAYVTLNVYIT